MEVFSAITGCVSLAIEIYRLLQDKLQDLQDELLILSIKHDLSILRDFSQIFDSASSDERITDADRLLLNEMCLTLRPNLVAIHSLVVRRRMSELTASRARKATEKMLQFLYKNEELQGISKEIFQWTERYHIRFGLLPPDLQVRVLAYRSSGDVTTLTGIHALKNTFAQLTLQGSNLPDAGIVLQQSDITLRPGADASRVFASYGQDVILLEFKPHKSTLAGQELLLFEAEVAKLIKLLSKVDAPLCRVLKSMGYFHQSSRFCFAMVYQLPRNITIPENVDTPVTLLDILSTTRQIPGRNSQNELLPPQHPLEQRFELARKIACAVMYVHMMQYVHKSIRSSNIVMLPKKGVSGETGVFPKHLGEPFLCGFETARHDKATSDQSGDAHWRYNIYRHPKRQGLYPQERYTMNHDIYSLGVVLLEIGLWRPLLTTGLAKLKDSSEEEIAAGKVKVYLKKMAKERLPVLVGTKFSDVVLFCLNVDGDGQVGQSRLIEEVLTKLEELSAGMQ